MQLLSSTLVCRNPAFSNTVRSSLGRRNVKARGALRILIKPSRLCRRFEVTDAKSSHSAKEDEKKKLKQSTTDSQMANLIDKLRLSNRNSHGKFSGVAGGSKLRNILKHSRPPDAKVAVRSIDELMSETQPSKELQEKSKATSSKVDVSGEESMAAQVPTISLNKEQIDDPTPSKDKPYLFAPSNSKIDDGFRLRQLVSTRKEAPKVFRSSVKRTKIAEMAEILSNVSPSLQSNTESSKKEDAGSNKELETSVSSYVITEVAEDPSDSSLDTLPIGKDRYPKAHTDSHIELSSLRGFKSVKSKDSAQLGKGVGYLGSDTNTGTVSDLFEAGTVKEVTGTSISQESRSVLDDMIAAQTEATKEKERSITQAQASLGSSEEDSAGVRDPKLSKYFQDFNSNPEASSTPDFRKIMKSASRRSSSQFAGKRRMRQGLKIFGSSRLNIFEESAVPTGEKKDFVSSHEKDLKYLLKTLEASSEPQNGFEAQLLTVDKVWQLPVDNEVSKPHEENVGFEEHVFLEYLLDEFPSVPAVQQFMELVINGLQQNPHLTVEQKKNRIMWFKDYFSQFSDEDLQLKVEQAIGM